MIRKETINNILDAVRIEEVVGDFVTLKRRGANYVGLCPFHNEKTPSFTVSPAKGFYYCFGCHKGGGAIDFIMSHEHLSYPEALKYLAQKYNIEIVEEEITEKDLLQQSELEALYNVVAFAQKKFTSNLLETEQGMAIGLSYLNERGFNRSVIKKFQLGYSPPAWDDFTKYALENGYKIEYLEKSGLSVKKEDGTYYDRFRDRIIFPIHNLTGRVIGFTGRILTSDKSRPKYINSPQSDIYDKSKSLYGIYFAKNAILHEDNCYLVEGNTDVISLYQAGIENVVASSGTSLTTDQIRLIKKFTKNITILYDGDEAGLKAAMRGIDMVLEEGMNVKVVIFPENEDPDSFARKHDNIQLKKFLTTQAQNFIVFKTQLLLRDAKKDPIKRAEVIKEIVRTIALIPEHIHRSIYVKECSDIMKISEQALVNELNKHLRKRFKKDVSITTGSSESTDVPEPPEYPLEKQLLPETTEDVFLERYLLWIILNYGSDVIYVEKQNEETKRSEQIPMKVCDFMNQILKENEFRFSNNIFQIIYDEYLEVTRQTWKSVTYHFTNHENDNVSKTVISILSQRYELSKYWREKYKIYTPRHEDENKDVLVKDIYNVINSINLKLITKEMENILNEIKYLQKEDPSSEKILTEMEKYKNKQLIKSKICAVLGDRVIN